MFGMTTVSRECCECVTRLNNGSSMVTGRVKKICVVFIIVAPIIINALTVLTFGLNSFVLSEKIDANYFTEKVNFNSPKYLIIL